MLTSKTRPYSFSLKEHLHQQLKDMFPKYGDRSKAVARLIELLVSGQVQIQLK